MWGEHPLYSPCENFREDFVQAAQKGDRSPVSQPRLVTGLRDKGYLPSVYEGRGLPFFEHCLEGVEQVRGYVLCTRVKELHWQAIVAWRFPFRESVDGFEDLGDRELLGEERVRVFQYPRRDAGPALLPSVLRTCGASFGGVKVFVEVGDVVSKILLACYGS